MRFLVFSDLDGTLLDHDTYDWSPARPALEKIRAEGWPLVLVTSKTRAEVEPIRKALDLDDPFIVENGAAAFFPERYREIPLNGAEQVGSYRALVWGRPYSEIRAFVEAVGHGLGVDGFGDMDVDRVRELTGLSSAEALLATRREYTEPFLLERGSDIAPVEIAASEHGLKVTTGGRFHHLIGDLQDKGVAVRAVAEVLATSHGERQTTIGLGDGPNDVPMLEAVDRAIVVPKVGRPVPEVSNRSLTVAPAPGPDGWSRALLTTILDPD